MTQYTVARRIPDRHVKFRWCVVKNDRIVAHRNLRTDALEMARQFNELDPPEETPQRANVRQRQGILRAGRLAINEVSRMIWEAPVIEPEPGEVRNNLYGELR